MRYRIEYTDNCRCGFEDSRQELIRQIRIEAPGAIEDIRKLYKNGISDSVMEKYDRFCKKCPYQSGNSGKSQ